MKKLTFALSLLCLAAQSATAQTFYLKAGAGYAFPMPGQKIDQYGNVLNGTLLRGSNTEHYNIKAASFSAGIQGALGGGLMITKNIGVELNANFNLAPVTFTESRAPTDKIDYYYTAERTANKFVTLIPSLLLQTANEKYNVYMRMGVALPIDAEINMRESYLFNSGTSRQFDWKITNYFSMGFVGATGASINTGDGFSVWGEVGMMSLGLARKEKDLTSAEVNNKPSQMMPAITHYYYNKEGYNDPNGNQSALTQPFSNLSASVGIRYQLNTRAKGDKE